MSNADYLAEAKIRIRPSFVGFEAALTAGITRAIATSASKTNAVSIAAGLKIGTAMSAGVAAGMSSAKATAPVIAAVTAQQSAIQAAINAGGVALQPAVTTTTALSAAQAGLAASNTVASQGFAKLKTSAAAVTPALNTVNKASAGTTAKLLSASTATSKLDSALLGVRAAVGSSAVIGLGALALAAIVVGKSIRALIRDTTAFETNLNTFKEVTGATASEMERVAEAARQLGADITLPNVSAGDAAETMLELSKAGLSVVDSIEGARGVLQLATAASIDNATAVELAASALNAFGLAGREATQVADVFANAANAAQGSISDIAHSLQQSSAVARQVGLSFADTSVYLTILAQNGLKGSDAGTSLRTALARLINPSKKASEVIKELGVDLRDTQGNLRVDIFQQFANATRGMTKAQRDQALAIIGGQDALRAFTILGRQSIRTLLQLREQLREEGTAADVAAARTKGLGGAAGALSSTLQTVGINIGTKIAPGLTDFVNGITSAINAMTSSEGIVAGFTTALDAVGTSLRVVGSIATTIAGPLFAAANALGALLAAVGSAASLTAASTLFGGFVLLPKLLNPSTVNVFTGALLQAARANAVLFNAFDKTGVAITRMATAIRGLTLASLAAGLRAVGASMVALLTSIPGIIIGLAAVAAGVVYLIARDSDLERAQKNLKSSTDELARAYSDLDAAQEGLDSAQRGVVSGTIALARARQEEAAARRAYETSNAPRGSKERVQLAINLATAIQSLAFAEGDLAKARKAAQDAQGDVGAASRRRKKALQEEVQAVQDLIAEERERAKAGGFGRAAALVRDTEAVAIRKVIAALREQARASKDAEDATVRETGVRSNLLAGLLSKQRELSREKIKLVFDDTLPLERIGRKLSRDFKDFGFKSSDEFIKWFISNIKTQEPRMSAALQEALKVLDDAGVGASATAGANSAKAYVDSFTAGIAGGRIAAGKAASDLIDAVFRGASDQEQLAILRRRRAAQEKTVAGLEGRRAAGDRKVTQKEIDAAKEAANQTAAQIEALEQSIASAAAKAESDAEDAKNKIIKAQDAQTQKIIDSFAGPEARINRRLIKAAATATLADDIRLNEDLLEIVQKKIRLIRARIKTLLRLGNKEGAADTRDVLRDVLEQQTTLQTQIATDTATRTKNIQDAAKKSIQRVIDSIGLDISLAEINENVAGQIKGKERLIAALKKAQDLEKRGSNAWKEYRNRIAETNKEIDELKGTMKERNNAFAELSFEFLQAQQGFAANLMSNLIGADMTAGLVGNISNAITSAPRVPSSSGIGGNLRTTGNPGVWGTAGIPATMTTGNPGVWGTAGPINRSITNEAALSGGTAPPTAGQMAKLIQVSSEMLRTLQDLRTGSGHPEAKRSKKMQTHGQDFGPYT